MDAQFHAERRTGLGGSDLGAILGLNPWRTPFEVWQEKTGRADPFEGNLQTRFGAYAEEFVAQEYSARTGRAVQRYTGMLRHPEAPVIGHIDRLVVPDGAKRASHQREIRTDLGLEAKTAHALAASRGDEWGEDGTDQVPSSYLVQSAAYMALTGCPRWDLACLFGNSDFRIYHLSRDLELESMLLDEASRWWRDHVVADVPPDPLSEAEARQRWSRHTEGKAIELSMEQAELLRRYAALKAQERLLEKEIQAARDLLMPALADADEIVINGQKVATYRANKAGSRTDWQSVAEDLFREFDLEEDFRCNTINSHTIITPGARVLRIAKTLEQTA
jgi:putative phage-type endonuclease